MKPAIPTLDLRAMRARTRSRALLRPPNGPEFRPKRHMTRWYEPLAMFRLLLRIWATRRMADQREQGADQPTRVLDYAQTDDDFWFDYVADLGDAFDPTMCVAWHLGRARLLRSDIDPLLRIDPEHGLPDLFPGMSAEEVPAVLPRGRLLLMGGDQIYPNGSDRRYRDQVTGPYSLAWEQDRADPDDEAGLLAIPANHDWYGGIGPFRSVFCSGNKIGGWRTAQRCSWWSARLAHGWWVWGLDTALDGGINRAQFDYFREVARDMPDDARLIVCTPVPLWRLRERHVDRLDKLARFFFAMGVDPEVYLSGDYHIAALHRRKRQDGTIEWHLTDGGGGAFQHPVHNLDREIPSRHGGLPEPVVADRTPLRLISSWPSNNESREGSGGWWNLLFDRTALSLIPTLALLQLPVMALTGSDHRSPTDDRRSLIDTALDQLVPFGAVAIVAIMALAVFGLAQPTSQARGATAWARRVGFGHGLMQSAVLGAAGLFGNLALRRTTAGLDGGAGTAVAWLTLTAAAAVAAVGVIVVLGSYLRFANRQFRMHDNESYSARRSGDNRHFTRFRIAPDGSLSCYMVAFRKTGTGWADKLRQLTDRGAGEAESGAAGDRVQVPPDASKPELIELRFRTAAADDRQ